MKLPKIVIEWSEPMKVPVTIRVQKLLNGYLIGNTFIASKELLADELVIAFENPHAYLVPPEYHD